MKLILNKTKKSTCRYTLLTGQMGSAGEKSNHVNHKYEIGIGVDRGNGYQGYASVSYFLSQPYYPQVAKGKIIAICKKENLIYTLDNLE